MPVRALANRKSSDSDDGEGLRRFWRGEAPPGYERVDDYTGRNAKHLHNEWLLSQQPYFGLHSSSTSNRKHSKTDCNRSSKKRKHGKSKVKNESALYSGWKLPNPDYVDSITKK